MNRSVISETASLTFADYFKLDAEVDEVLADLGFAFEAKRCGLPMTKRALARVDELKARLEETLPHVNLTSEAARREFLIAPILMDVIHYTRSRIRVEYPLEINPQLRGTLDYLIQLTNSLLVIEAKNADLTRGFTQLAVELIALDQWVKHDAPLLYGSVSTGNVWQFGILDRSAKRVTQDFNLYALPADLETLLRILVGILTGE